MSSANALNVVKSKIVSFDKELAQHKLCFQKMGDERSAEFTDSLDQHETV